MKQYTNHFRVVCTLILVIGINLLSAQIFYGTNNYIEYHQGYLPILITAPHGGSVAPLAIPDRTCNSPVTAPDINTRDLAFQIDTALFNLTGCHPHVVVCNLARIKLDANRTVAAATCGNTLATIAYNEFHNFIDTAQAKMKAQHNRGFYADIHGHSHPIQRMELGYLLSETTLALPASSLNTTANVNQSSIKNLVNTNVNSYALSDLLTGPFALGTLLASAGYSAVPSMQDPYPLSGQPYFQGGYDIDVHSSATGTNIINAVQIESYYTGVRDTYQNRKKFADTLAKQLMIFMNHHHNQTTSNCLITNINDIKSHLTFNFYFDNQSKVLTAIFEKEGNNPVSIYNINGELKRKFVCTQKKEKLLLNDLPEGIYFVRDSGNRSRKFIIN